MTKEFDKSQLKNLFLPDASSHKGMNGKVLVIGGSHLFHSASLWALEIASKLVDMVFYASVPENNAIVQSAKEQFKNGIVVQRKDIESYIEEADAIVIGPGLMRTTRFTTDHTITSLTDLDEIDHEGVQTYHMTKYLLKKYPHKKWVIDAGALQMLELDWLRNLNGNVILTPHHKELENFQDSILNFQSNSNEEMIQKIAKEYNCVVLLKGEVDVICNSSECTEISGGNAGMTKGGTGDVLAGLVGALATKNDMFLAATAASYINKKAGESLFTKVGYFFNSSDLVNEIPKVMKDLLL